jgi:hypothetical protein
MVAGCCLSSVPDARRPVVDGAPKATVAAEAGIRCPVAGVGGGVIGPSGPGCTVTIAADPAPSQLASTLALPGL